MNMENTLKYLSSSAIELLEFSNGEINNLPLDNQHIDDPDYLFIDFTEEEDYYKGDYE